MSNLLKYSLLGWLAYTLIWIWIISNFIDLTPSVIRVLAITIPEMILFYLNLYYFIPRFLDGNSRVNYFMVIFIVIGIATFLGASADLYLDLKIPFHNFKHLERPLYTSYVARFFMSVMPIIVSSLVNRSMQVRKQREESLELKNKMLEAETKALKAQINPHFLFNSMNNIYALAQAKSDKAPAAIMHLSDILRFVTYDSNQNEVDLKDEIKTIESFIMLQALKDEDQSNIRIEIENQNGHYKIAPLLLIPFIENCFKHSNHDDKEKGWITIQLKAANGQIHLLCKNSKPDQKMHHDKTGGVGLENVKKRLALLYPNQHQLSISDTESKYEIELIVVVSK